MSIVSPGQMFAATSLPTNIEQKADVAKSDFEKRLDTGIASFEPPTPKWVKVGLTLLVILTGFVVLIAMGLPWLG